MPNIASPEEITMHEPIAVLEPLTKDIQPSPGRKATASKFPETPYSAWFWDHSRSLYYCSRYNELGQIQYKFSDGSEQIVSGDPKFVSYPNDCAVWLITTSSRRQLPIQGHEAQYPISQDLQSHSTNTSTGSIPYTIGYSSGYSTSSPQYTVGHLANAQAATYAMEELKLGKDERRKPRQGHSNSGKYLCVC
jgi:hypothetical protein